MVDVKRPGVLNPFNRLAKKSVQNAWAKNPLLLALAALAAISFLTSSKHQHTQGQHLRKTLAERTLSEVPAILHTEGQGLGDIPNSSDLNKKENEALSTNKKVMDHQNETVVEEGKPVESSVEGGGETIHSDNFTDNIGEEGIASSYISLRDQLLARSLEAKQFVMEALQEVVAPLQAPRYFHYEPSVTETKSSSSCEFEEIPVENWIPPETFPTDSIKKWEGEHKISMSKIGTSDVGGSELRELAKAETESLRELRRALFCED